MTWRTGVGTESNTQSARLDDCRLRRCRPNAAQAYASHQRPHNGWPSQEKEKGATSPANSSPTDEDHWILRQDEDNAIPRFYTNRYQPTTA